MSTCARTPGLLAGVCMRVSLSLALAFDAASQNMYMYTSVHTGIITVVAVFCRSR